MRVCRLNFLFEKSRPYNDDFERFARPALFYWPQNYYSDMQMVSLCRGRLLNEMVMDVVNGHPFR